VSATTGSGAGLVDQDRPVYRAKRWRDGRRASHGKGEGRSIDMLVIEGRKGCLRRGDVDQMRFRRKAASSAMRRRHRPLLVARLQGAKDVLKSGEVICMESTTLRPPQIESYGCSWLRSCKWDGGWKICDGEDGGGWALKSVGGCPDAGAIAVGCTFDRPPPSTSATYLD
jgi:hypothetical protein